MKASTRSLVLHGLEYDSELFESLLMSFPKRIQAVIDADGGHTEY
jgi:hypothetical protein